jgi:hypothetical protein
MNPSILFKKLPSLEQTAQVFAVIAMVNYSWAILRFFYRFPSWLFYSSLGEVLTFLAYLITLNGLESLVVLLILVLAGVLLPRRWLLDRFVTRSLSLVLPALGILIYVNLTYPTEAGYPLASLRWVGTTALFILVVAFLADKVGFLRNLLDGMANRMTIFLYLIIPVSVVSIFIVLIRNIL